MAEHYDSFADFAADYVDPQSAFDCTKMRTLVGWTPPHSWRDQLD
ncbi:hypothetical protein [Microlunatus soli]|nr:hypothetical protein [Microlunatus soli]